MRLSVAMCTYNGAKYVEKQLQSILCQDLPIDEIVVCDDCSKDDTIGIVERVALDHPEVKWNIQVNSPNLGVVRNFEKAINLCTGDIVFLSDQDDIWHSNKTSIIADYFEANQDVTAVFTDANLVGKDGQLVTDYSMLDSVFLLPNIKLWEDGFQFELLNVWNVATGATMAFRKSFRSQFLPFIIAPEGLLHDNQIARVACRSNSLGIIKQRLIDYRQHGGNTVGVGSDNWVYTNERPPSLLPMIAIPHPVGECFQEWDDERVLFYEKRYHNSLSLSGILRIISSTFMYKRLYGNYWMTFYTSDILFAVKHYAKSVYKTI